LDVYLEQAYSTSIAERQQILGAAMSATTTSSNRIETKTSFERFAQAFRIKARRAIELWAASYANGPMPPL
jgi:hypothetical protein